MVAASRIVRLISFQSLNVISLVLANWNRQLLTCIGTFSLKRRLLPPLLFAAPPGADLFTQKTCRIHGLLDRFQKAKTIEEVRRVFSRIVEGLSGLLDAALKDKLRRVEQWRDLAPAEAEAKERSESALLKQRSSRFQEIRSNAVSIVQKVLDRYAGPRRRPHEAENAFAADAYRWLSVSSPRHSYTFRLNHALSLLSRGCLFEAAGILRELSPFLPEAIGAAMKALPPPDQLTDAHGARLEHLLRTNRKETSSSLAAGELEMLAPPVFSNLLRQRPILAALLQYLAPIDLQKAAPNWREITEGSLPREYLSARAGRILNTFYFSLAHGPAASCDIEEVAIYAMIRNGFEYGLLSEELRRTPLIIKLAILSILKIDQTKIDEFLEQVLEPQSGEPSAQNPEFGKRSRLAFAREASQRLMICAKEMVREERIFDVLVRLAPFDEEICALAVQHVGLSLRFASSRIRNNLRIVSLAVLQNGLALEFAGDAIQDDPFVVESAVRQNGMAFKFAGAEMKKPRP